MYKGKIEPVDSVEDIPLPATLKFVPISDLFAVKCYEDNSGKFYMVGDIFENTYERSR